MKTFTMTKDEFFKQSHITISGVLWVDIGTYGCCEASVDFSLQDGAYRFSGINTRLADNPSRVVRILPCDKLFSEFLVITPFGTINEIPLSYINHLKERLEEEKQ